jgi:hypothetical protein
MFYGMFSSSLRQVGFASGQCCESRKLIFNESADRANFLPPALSFSGSIARARLFTQMSTSEPVIKRGRARRNAPLIQDEGCLVNANVHGSLHQERRRWFRVRASYFGCVATPRAHHRSALCARESENEHIIHLISSPLKKLSSIYFMLYSIVSMALNWHPRTF